MSQIPDDYNKGGYYTFLGTMIFVVVFFIVLVAFVMPDLKIGQNIPDELNPGAAAEGAAVGGVEPPVDPPAEEGAEQAPDSEAQVPVEEE